VQPRPAATSPKAAPMMVPAPAPKAPAPAPAPAAPKPAAAAGTATPFMTKLPLLVDATGGFAGTRTRATQQPILPRHPANRRARRYLVCAPNVARCAVQRQRARQAAPPERFGLAGPVPLLDDPRPDHVDPGAVQVCRPTGARRARVGPPPWADPTTPRPPGACSVRRIVDSNLVKLLVNWFVEAVRDNKPAFIKSSLEVGAHPPVHRWDPPWCSSRR